MQKSASRKLIIILYGIVCIPSLKAMDNNNQVVSKGIYAISDYMRPKYVIGAGAVLGIGGIWLYQYCKAVNTTEPESKLQISKPKVSIVDLKQDQLHKLHKLFASVSDDSITSLYRWTGAPWLLVIPKDQLEEGNLKELFEASSLVPSGLFWSPKSWNNEDWQDASQCLIKREEKQENNIYLEQKEKLYFDKSQTLLHDAKSILKSFLPVHTIDSSLEQNFIIKGGACSRLFVYARLQQVIEQKKLSHVRLPIKLLAVKNERTDKYIFDSSMIESILDEGMKVRVRLPSQLEAHLDFYSDDYRLVVFAHRQEKNKIGLSPAALTDLNELVKEVPFDVGYDNIFSDSNGDAVIIDTEYKGEDGELSLAKLNSRYKK